MIALDTAVLYALLDAGDANHERAAAWYGTLDEELVTTPFVIAETDRLVRSRGNPDGLARFRDDLAAGAPAVEWHPEMMPVAVETADAYSDLGVSLTDASLVTLASRLDTDRVATFDERHFRAMRPLSGQPAFTLLPADAVR